MVSGVRAAGCWQAKGTGKVALREESLSDVL